MTAATWRALTRNDVKTFDRVAQDVILEAMQRGGVGRISTKGHCIIRAPGGGTMSVSRNTNAGNRSAENTRADFRRLFGDDQERSELTNGSVEVTAQQVSDLSTDVQTDPTNPTIECPVDDCEAVFVTEGARYTHIHKVHFPCSIPGCDYVGKTKAGLGPHVRIKHGGHKPWELAKEKRAMAKQADHKLLETIRELLGTGEETQRAKEDAQRIKELEQELKAAEKKITTLEGKLDKLRAALA